MSPAEKLIEILELEQLEIDLFRGHSPNTEVQRVFGGQVIGQALSAASKTVEDRACHSLHAYFLRPGDPKVPIIYQVERVRDGRSFATRRVVAIQHGQPIFNLGANFHNAEADAFEHQITMPDVLPPEEMPYNWHDLGEMAKQSGVPEAWIDNWVKKQPLDFLFPDSAFARKDNKLPHQTYTWFRNAKSMELSDLQEQCIVAFASDMTLLDSSLRPHGASGWTMTAQIASLDHAMWFHAPVRTSDWLLYVKDSPFAGGARGFTRGSVFDRSGKLIASVAQEGLIRPLRKS